ncbi:MAG: hypothetical protein R2827_08925 [Bdellovibrionales bacterium]
MSFIINSPHFLISYMHFYSDHRKKILTKKSWIFAGLGVPLLLVAWMGIAFIRADILQLSYLVNLMYFLVGWHYVKQVFGCMVITAQRSNYAIEPKLRRGIKLNLYGLWALTYFATNHTVHKYDFYSLKYATFSLPKELFYASYVFVGLSLGYVLYLVVKQYVEQGRWMPVNTATPFVAIYTWYIPAFYHPAFLLLVPAFHSLQYLLFSITFTKNRILDEKSRGESNAKTIRAKFIKNFGAYLVSAILLGALFFEFVPKSLDHFFDTNLDSQSSTLIAACFVLFINIHHYFIDHVIWRGSLPEVRKYLLR